MRGKNEWNGNNFNPVFPNSAFAVQTKEMCAECISSALLVRRTRVLVSAGMRALRWIQNNHECSFHIVISLCAHRVFLFHSNAPNCLCG